MMILPASRVLRAWIALCLLALVACSTQAGSLFWKAEKNGQVVWLLGSVHVGSTAFYPLPPAVEKAFAASKSLMVEADVSSPAAQKQLTQFIRLPKGQSLDSVLGQDLAKRLLIRVNDPQLSDAVLRTFQPWFLCTAIEMQIAAKLGYDPEQGIDLHYLKMAREQRKPVVELESVAAQGRMLSGLTQAETRHFVSETLSQLEDQSAARQFADLVDAWRQGDELAMDRLLRESFDDSALSRALMGKILYGRNPGMARGIAAQSRQQSPIMVVVGAGHLVGQGSVIQLLKQDGFTVSKW
ncbi:TraB/GumN family protein [Burkholderiaceae bacterium DAT-1]|nr:TraB/GumN family protein [Burkholderiaceae bacterium DAT-1]